MARLLAVIVPFLALFVPSTRAGSYWPSNDTKAVCDALIKEYPGKLVWDPLGPYGTHTALHASKYNSANLDYWNAANSLNRAACAFCLSTTEEVAFAVQTLNKYESVQFALKGRAQSQSRLL